MESRTLIGTLMGFLVLIEKKAVVTSEVKKLAQKICGIMEVHMLSYLNMQTQTTSMIPVFMIRNHFKKSDMNVFMI